MTLFVSYHLETTDKKASGFGNCTVENGRAPRTGKEMKTLQKEIEASLAPETGKASVVILNWISM